MRIYIIGNDGITLCREAPASVTDGEIAVASQEELHAAPLSGKRLLALWNALPDVEKRKKVGDRGALIDQLWSAIEALPDPEPQPDGKRQTAFRREVRPFSEKEIALLQNFAAQAVIAIENARLLTETREALEQQTATAEVLQVINSSPGDLAPVFDAMLEKAMRLCEAPFGALLRFDGKVFRAIAARDISGAAAVLGDPVEPDPGSVLERLVLGEEVVHIPDVIDTEAYRSGVASRLKLVEIIGARTALWVALRKNDVLLGDFALYRKEVRPFTDKQIALLQNFAAQAIIAMENARLIAETREALEQQTATAEVLGVINSSPGDLAPVFDAILEKTHSLCGVEYGALFLYDGEQFRAVAVRGYPEKLDQFLRQPYSLKPNSPVSALLHGEALVEIPDVIAHQAEAPNPRAEAAIALGIRGVLFLPLRGDNQLLGMITAARKESRPFSEKEIALLQNFAAQAVIAMENARLITETREALEQQTATAEVLQVIYASPGDLAPVFDTMLEKATRLCGAERGSFWSFDGQAFQVLASTIGDTGRTMQPGPDTALWRIARGESVVQIADARTEPASTTEQRRPQTHRPGKHSSKACRPPRSAAAEVCARGSVDPPSPCGKKR